MNRTAAPAPSFSGILGCWSRCHGYADREREIPNTLKTKFIFGPMGKLLTSAGRDAPRTWDIPAMNYKLEAWLAVWILAMEASLHAFNLPASAHHAFAAEYDNEQPITLSGTLTKLVWANPHCWIYVDVKDVRSGAVVSWSIELGSTNALLRQGLRGTDFLAGEVVTVRGYLAKGSPNVANGVGIRLLDGRNLFTGS